MEGMTDLQTKILMKAIMTILDSSETLEEAREKIKALMNEIQ